MCILQNPANTASADTSILELIRALQKEAVMLCIYMQFCMPTGGYSELNTLIHALISNWPTKRKVVYQTQQTKALCFSVSYIFKCKLYFLEVYQFLCGESNEEKRPVVKGYGWALVLKIFYKIDWHLLFLKCSDSVILWWKKESLQLVRC